MEKITIVVNKNEEKILPFIWFNNSKKNYDLTVRLVGDNSSVHIYGLFLGRKSHSVTFNTTVIHEAKNTLSRTIIKGVFFDTSSINNDGLITIKNGAKNSDGYFKSKILLFDNSKGRSVPSLEIDENEVKAGHASTIGRPRKEELLYIRSRGLKEKESELLIVQGFFTDVLKNFSYEDQKKFNLQIKKLL